MKVLDLQHGVGTSIGSLPHTDPRAAATFVLERHPRLPAAPSLPNRSGMERMIAQAAWGIDGVRVLPDGSLELDDPILDPRTPLTTAGIDGEPFVGLRAFLGAVAGRRAPIKLQLTGPVTLGIALLNLGVPSRRAFAVAGSAVRARARALVAAAQETAPMAPLVVFVDEPGLTAAMHAGFPLDPNRTIDLVSSALATIEPHAVTGPALLRLGRLARRAPGRPADPVAPARLRRRRALRRAQRLPRARRSGGVGCGADQRPASAPPPSACGSTSPPSGARSRRAAAIRSCSATRRSSRRRAAWPCTARPRPTW